MSIVSESVQAKKALLKVAHKLANQELKKVSKRSGKKEERMHSLEGEVDLNRLKEFSWSSVIDEARDKLPCVTGLLEDLLPAPSHMRQGVTKGSKNSVRSLHSCKLAKHEFKENITEGGIVVRGEFARDVSLFKLANS